MQTEKPIYVSQEVQAKPVVTTSIATSISGDSSVPESLSSDP